MRQQGVWVWCVFRVPFPKASGSAEVVRAVHWLKGSFGVLRRVPECACLVEDDEEGSSPWFFVWNDCQQLVEAGAGKL